MTRPALVIFDLAGTVLDHGCCAPVHAFRLAFEQVGVPITAAEARAPMGLNKIDHVRSLLQMERVGAAFREVRGRAWTEADVEQVYVAFLPLQARAAEERAGLIEGAAAACGWLEEHGLQVMATTGYPRSIVDPVLARARAEGFLPRATFCADEVPAGRPAPWLIHRCMEAAGVYPARRVVKVGDTRPDMEAGLNAGTRVVAVSETSSEVGLGAEELDALASGERSQRIGEAEARLRDAGAEAVIPSVARLPELIQGWLT